MPCAHNNACAFVIPIRWSCQGRVEAFFDLEPEKIQQIGLWGSKPVIHLPPIQMIRLRTLTRHCRAYHTTPSTLLAGGERLWGGRFTGETDPLMIQFNNSIDFDQRWCYVDIRGSKAYAKATHRVGILTNVELNQMLEGLDVVEREWQDGTFQIQPTDEDIHTANERRLSEIIGSDVAGKLHTGRSRNDQVATDARMWLRDEIEHLDHDLMSLIEVATERALREVDIIMPGYTHLQPAQPVRWSHWM